MNNKIITFRRHKSKTSETPTTRQGHKEDVAAYEVHTDHSEEGAELDHYATVKSISPFNRSPLEKESETQYATLGFSEAAGLKNDSGQFPLNVL